MITMDYLQILAIGKKNSVKMNKSEFRTLAFRVVPIGDETEFTGRTNLHAMNSDGRLEPATGHYKSGDE